MSMHRHAALDDTVYLYFASNNTAGSGDNGATPAAHVRLGGALATAAPVHSPTPALLTNAAYPAGAHEVAVACTAANGFASGSSYGVFCTLAVDGQNPTGFIGSITLAPVLSQLAPNVTHGGGTATRLDLNNSAGTAPPLALTGNTSAECIDINPGVGQDGISIIHTSGVGRGIFIDTVDGYGIKIETDNNSCCTYDTAGVGHPGIVITSVFDTPVQYNGTPMETAFVNEWETLSQADPTGFQVNAKQLDDDAAAASNLKTGASALRAFVVGASPSATSIPTDITGAPFTNANHFKDRVVTINQETKKIIGSSGSPVVLTVSDFVSVPSQNDIGVIS